MPQITLPSPHHLQYTEKTYPFFGFQAYGLSKLGNIRFARELSHRFSSSYSLQSFVIHPGLKKSSKITNLIFFQFVFTQSVSCF